MKNNIDTSCTLKANLHHIYEWLGDDQKHQSSISLDKNIVMRCDCDCISASQNLPVNVADFSSIGCKFSGKYSFIDLCLYERGAYLAYGVCINNLLFGFSHGHRFTHTFCLTKGSRRLSWDVCKVSLKDILLTRQSVNIAVNKMDIERVRYPFSCARVTIVRSL